MAILQEIDIMILNMIQTYLHYDFLNSIMIFLSRIGDGGFVWITIGVLFLLSKKYRKYGFLILIALGLEALFVNITLKPLIQRIRPFNINTTIELLIPSPRDFSFPSGHTASAFAAATILLYTNRKIAISGMILASLIAFSRLYLYVHFPSDIIAGVLIGMISGWIVMSGYRRWSLKQS